MFAFTNAFGLDIGDLSIKLVRLKIHRPLLRGSMSFEIAEARQLRLPPGYIVDGELLQPELVRKKIIELVGQNKKWWNKLPPWVVADLPETKTFLKLITIDSAPADLTDAQVRAQAANHLPFDLADAYLDWQVTSFENGHSQILLGAAPKITTDSYTYLLASAGLTPLTLEIEGAPLARTMITANKTYTGEARAILDLGAARSGLVIYDNNNLQFSFSLKFSGEKITAALAAGLNLDHDQAENLKIKNGINFDESRPTYLKIISEQTDELVAQITAALKFYQEHFPAGNAVTRIIMCGGGAQCRSLDVYLSRALAIEFKVGHSLKNLGRIFPEQENFAFLPYASALGMALRAARFAQYY